MAFKGLVKHWEGVKWSQLYFLQILRLLWFLFFLFLLLILAKNFTNVLVSEINKADCLDEIPWVVFVCILSRPVAITTQYYYQAEKYTEKQGSLSPQSVLISETFPCLCTFSGSVFYFVVL